MPIGRTLLTHNLPQNQTMPKPNQTRTVVLNVAWQLQVEESNLSLIAQSFICGGTFLKLLLSICN